MSARRFNLHGQARAARRARKDPLRRRRAAGALHVRRQLVRARAHLEDQARNLGRPRPSPAHRQASPPLYTNRDWWCCDFMLGPECPDDIEFEVGQPVSVGLSQLKIGSRGTFLREVSIVRRGAVEGARNHPALGDPGEPAREAHGAGRRGHLRRRDDPPHAQASDDHGPLRRVLALAVRYWHRGDNEALLGEVLPPASVSRSAANASLLSWLPTPAAMEQAACILLAFDDARNLRGGLRSAPGGATLTPSIFARAWHRSRIRLRAAPVCRPGVRACSPVPLRAHTSARTSHRARACISRARFPRACALRLGTRSGGSARRVLQGSSRERKPARGGRMTPFFKQRGADRDPRSGPFSLPGGYVV